MKRIKSWASLWMGVPLDSKRAFGAKMADRLGFQYIVTMNEDALPAELLRDFDLQQYIVPTRLRDATEDGSLEAKIILLKC